MREGGPEGSVANRESGSRIVRGDIEWILPAESGVAKCGGRGLAGWGDSVSYLPSRAFDVGEMPVLVFDFDSTLVSVEGLDELFARSLSGAADRAARVAAFREITDLGMAGKLSAEESLSRRLSILSADRRQVDAVGESIRASLTPSVARHRGFFKENAARIYVLSGGFEELIQPTLRDLEIPAERLLAHRFIYDDEGMVVGVDPETAVARGGKPGALRTVAKPSEPMWAIGDGATDLELRTLGLVDRFVAFTENRSREPVVARADAVARSMDELLTLLETN